jgi:hypothetical protein
MPLNLAQTAISALKIGENALTAIYSGITRVYPNEVTVSIDGANASTQSGTPGQPMNSLIYVVTPSNVNNYGWTDAQIAAATLTGLPAGFTATFSVSGSLGSQSGTWTITTTDGNFPNTDTTITVASLTSTIAETTWGSIQVSISGAQFPSATQTASNFVGSSVSIGQGQSDAYYTDVGQLYSGVGSLSGSVTSGQAATSITASGTNSYQGTIYCNYTIQATGTATSAVSVSGSMGSVFTARVPILEINGPPWNANPSSDIQTYLKVGWDNTQSTAIDNRVRWWGWTDFTGGTQSSPHYWAQMYQLMLISPISGQGNTYYNYAPGNGSGSYTINIQTNIGISGPTWASNQSTRPGGASVSISWNWN